MAKQATTSTEKQFKEFLNATKPNYGKGMRMLRGIMDLSQKEMAARLNMPAPQLCTLEKKDTWTDDILQRVAESLNIPVAGLDYLATAPDLVGLFFSDNTIGDGGIMGQNNNFQITYQFGNAAKIDDLFERFEGIINKWTDKVQNYEDKLNNKKPK